jgi:HlyD family secretion protein
MKLSPRKSSPQLTKSKPQNQWRLPHLPRFSFKQLLYITLAIATVILVVFAFRPTPIRVDVAQVSQGNLQVTVNAEGKTRVRDRFIITAPANGHLDRIQLNAGDPVQAGMLIARIDPVPLTASVKEALGRLAEAQAQRSGVDTQRPKPETLAQARTRISKAEAELEQALTRVRQAQAALAQARRDRERAQKLATVGAISRQDREAAELNESSRARELETANLATQTASTEIDVARNALIVLQKQQADPDYLLRVYDARIASIKAELSSLRQEADRTDIRSPVTGRILRIWQKSAQFVTDGTPLLEIADSNHLELVIDVLSSDAVKIKPGNLILIDQGEGQEPLYAKVRLVEPSAFTKVSALGVEEQRVNVIGDFTSPTQGLGDAYRLETQIVIWQRNNVLRVPLSALFRCNRTTWCVFTVQAKKAHQQVVAIGQHSDLAAEVKQGLNSGDIVILHPTEQIRNNHLVELPK